MRTPGTESTKGNTRSMYSAWGLASYLEEELLAHHFGKFPGGCPRPVVASHISRWIHKDKVAPALIKAMIDSFISSPANFRKGTPPWKSFVNLRQKLLADVERVTTQQEARRRVEDRDYWRVTTPQRFNPVDWGGASATP